MIDNTPCPGQQQTLSFYATKSDLPSSVKDPSSSHQICIQGIVTKKRDMKLELIYQSKAKVAYQHDLAADIIDRKHDHLCGSNALSGKIQRDDLIDKKIRSMNESNARHNLFTLLKFDIKRFINPSSIKWSALTRIDITPNDVISSLTTKGKLEDHLLQRNPIP
jgi:hypothetical protein